MYIDFDYESIENMEVLLDSRQCCFAMEPNEQFEYFQKPVMFNNALMVTVPGHDFFRCIIDNIFTDYTLCFFDRNKNFTVLKTTGPLRLIYIYIYIYGLLLQRAVIPYSIRICNSL